MNTKTPSRLLVTALAALVVFTSSAHAGANYRQHSGYVDGTPFVDVAGQTGDLIEITLHGRLLNLITQRAIRRHDEELGAVLAGLVSMHAVITEVDDRSPNAARRIEEGRDLVKRLGRHLIDEGWERFIRVREQDGEDILAYVHLSPKDEINGLVVMGMTGEDELLFVNLAGVIDMDAVAVIGDRFDFPGLDGLPDEGEIKREHRERKTTIHETIHIQEDI